MRICDLAGAIDYRWDFGVFKPKPRFPWGRVVALVLACVLFCAMFAGCGGTSADSSVSELDIATYKGVVAITTKTLGEASPDKPLRKDCKVCNGTGKVRSGDGLFVYDCTNCVPPTAAAPEPCNCFVTGECSCDPGTCACAKCVKHGVDTEALQTDLYWTGKGLRTHLSDPSQKLATLLFQALYALQACREAPGTQAAVDVAPEPSGGCACSGGGACSCDPCVCPDCGCEKCPGKATQPAVTAKPAAPPMPETNYSEIPNSSTADRHETTDYAIWRTSILNSGRFPRLLYWSTEGCVPCAKLETDEFPKLDPSFTVGESDRSVIQRMPDDPELRREFGVKEVPWFSRVERGKITCRVYPSRTGQALGWKDIVACAYGSADVFRQPQAEPLTRQPLRYLEPQLPYYFDAQAARPMPWVFGGGLQNCGPSG